MLARMIDFLNHESANFRLQLGWGIGSMLLDRIDEEHFATGEGHGQGIVPGGCHWIAVEPPSCARIHAGKAPVTGCNCKIAWRTRILSEGRGSLQVKFRRRGHGI